MVRLIGPDGKNLGIVPREEALRQAAAYQLDLVEIVPNADPPVCRIVDYGKFLYERKKKEKKSRKKQARSDVKEMRLRPRTAAHDRNIKVREAREWLETGKKVRVVMLFQGREITYPEIALENLKEVAQMLADVARIEVPPKLEGKRLVMVLAPLPASKRKAAAKAEKNE